MNLQHMPQQLLTVREKAAAYQKNGGAALRGTLLCVDKHSTGGRKVFNPSTPFCIDGVSCMALRVGDKEKEALDKSVFFERRGGVWCKNESLRVYELQDPNIQFFDGGEIVFSGVNAWTEGSMWGWKCEFYRGESLSSLKHFLSGPLQMKDIRFFPLKDGRVGVFTRPQGLAYRAKSGHIADVGFAVFPTLEDVTAKKILEAPLLENLFHADEWGGVNHVYPLNNGLFGIICHLAYGDGEFREGLDVHYFAAAFVFDAASGAFTDPCIIAARSDFDGEVLCVPRARDVVFPGGIERLAGDRAVLYVGLSDGAAAQIEIDDPFAAYERGEKGVR